jgi:hypothetical protein
MGSEKSYCRTGKKRMSKEEKTRPRRYANSEHYYAVNRRPVAPQVKDLRKQKGWMDSRGRLYCANTTKDYDELIATVMKPFEQSEQKHSFFWVSMPKGKQNTAQGLPVENEKLQVGKEEQYTVVVSSPRGFTPYTRSRKTGYVVVK